VLGRVLRERGLLNGYSGVPGVEAVARYREGARYLFLLNHADSPSSVIADLAGVSLRTRAQVSARETIVLGLKDVMILMSP
jgi:beta-galactosidase